MPHKIILLLLMLTSVASVKAMHQDASSILSSNKATSEFISNIRNLEHKGFIYRKIYHEQFINLRTTLSNEYESCYWTYIIQASNKEEAILNFRHHLLPINEGENIFAYEDRLDQHLKNIIGIELGTKAIHLRRTTLILQQISVFKAYMHLFDDLNFQTQFDAKMQQYSWLLTLQLPYEIPTVQKLHLHL